MFKTQPNRKGKGRAPKKPPPAPEKKPRGRRGQGYVMDDRRTGGKVGRLPVGRLPSGRTRYVEVRGATEAEVVAKMRTAAPPDPKAVTVAEWAGRWVAGLDVRPSTLAGYRRQLDARLLPDLGHLKLCELSAGRVKLALKGWAKAGTPTANRTRAVGAAMVAAAVLDGVCVRNAFADCPKLKYEPKELDPFRPEELKLIISAHGLYTAGPILAFLAATGARIGEAAALDVEDWDAAAGTVKIRRTWSRDHGMRAPKSRQSRRTIAVPAAVRAVVTAAAGARRSGPLFRSTTGGRFCSVLLHVALTRLLKRLGLRRRGPHQMRHGVATALVSAGVPIGDVAKYLGHSAASVVRTYLHPAGADVALAISELLG